MLAEIAYIKAAEDTGKPKRKFTPVWVFDPTDRQFHDHYQLVNKLGQGAYGSIYSCRNSEGKQFAVKMVFKQHFRNELDMFRQEIEIMKQVDHPNLIRFIDWFENERYLFIVMEKSNGVDLWSHILDNFTHYEETTWCCCFKRKPKTEKKQYSEREVSIWMKQVG